MVEASGADWPLTRKFDTSRDKALRLLGLARDLGLAPVSFSFHVGSRTRKPEMWAATLDQVAAILAEAVAAGFDLSLINIGGGFTACYGSEIARPTDYAAAVMPQVNARFPGAARVKPGPGRTAAWPEIRRPGHDLQLWGLYVQLFLGRLQ